MKKVVKELKNMDELEDIINKAIDGEISLSLFIKLPDLVEPEVITNPPTNLKQKLKYYKETYNDNLEHKYAKGVKILGW
jgi:hypothetical protein